jgi:hypothetical protein
VKKSQDPHCQPHDYKNYYDAKRRSRREGVSISKNWLELGVAGCERVIQAADCADRKREVTWDEMIKA